MNIKRIVGDHFVGHEQCDVEFPDKGIVLVTGPNGSGKSSFVEAGPVAVFGKTLRGTNPWNGKKGFIEVEVGDYIIRRTRSGGRSTVSVEGGPNFDTAAKATEWLLETFGTFETWRRTHVFSAQDAAHFTTASDGERKRLLEQLLGLGHFATAHSLCLKDLRATEKELVELQHKAQLLQVSVDHSISERKNLKEQLADLPDAPSPEKDESENQDEERDLEDAIRKVRLAASDASNSTAAADAGVRVWRERVKNLEADECYTCGQDISPALKDEATLEVADAQAHAATLHDEARATKDLLEVEERQLREKLREIQSAKATKRAAADELQRANRIRKRVETQLANVEKSIPAAYEKLEDAEVKRDELTFKAGVLRASDKVLGLKGVRAHVLGKTLGGIEAVANSWLTLIAGEGLALSLSPYKEKKKGGVTDAISLEIEGAGGGFGYKASSGGERRRIDVALLLALADIAGTTSGATSDTLFFDEVFDSLDEAGVEATISALEELSADRAVVIISHSEYLASRLSPVKHIKLGP